MNEKYPDVKTYLTKLFKLHGYNLPVIRKGKEDIIDIYAGKITIRPYVMTSVEIHAKSLFIDYLLGMAKRGEDYQAVIKNTLIGLV